MKIFTGCVTDRGNFRAKNQDRAVCHVKKHKTTPLAVGCVCDGIGSFSNSEIASQMVTDGISRWFEGVKELFPESMDEDMLIEDLEMTLNELNELVYDFHERKGVDIGCTMSLMVLVGQNFYVFHVGDSRIYQVGETAFQITKDEVVMVESGGRIKSLLANFVGKAPKLWMNRFTSRVEGQEMFLLGSDGLFKQLTSQDMVQWIGQIKNDSKAQKDCGFFLDLVLERGERDNVSCVLIYVLVK